MTDAIGVFRPSDTTWYLDVTANGEWDGCAVDRCSGSFGKAGDLPLAGDWNGSGTSSIGVFRPSDVSWTLDSNGNGLFDGCAVDQCITGFGNVGDLPVVGDWNGTGPSRIGVFRPSDGSWSLDANGNGLWDGCAIDQCGSFGSNGDLPVVGDWNGSGRASVGVFRPSDSTWFLDANGNGLWDGCAVDVCVASFGSPGDRPVAGDWDGNGSAEIGVFRPSDATWALDDASGNGLWDGCAVDICALFGNSEDLPIVGHWGS